MCWRCRAISSGATSEGCNLLIRDGAHPVLSAKDLIESLELILGRSPRVPVSPPITAGAESLEEILETADRPVGAVLADVMKAELAGRLQSKGVDRRARLKPVKPKMGLWLEPERAVKRTRST